MNQHEESIRNMVIDTSKIDCLIEVSKGSNVKYEFDKEGE